MSELDRAALAHDIGKYVCRIARNVPDGGPFPAALAPLLAKDLYELPGGGRPSAAFDARAPSGDLPEVRGAFARIDAIEPDVRAGDPTACLEACALARAIDDALRAYARADR
ncbi:MAG: hypothetical protein AB7S26_10085 [Sandaracinaceae bacterium]